VQRTFGVAALRPTSVVANGSIRVRGFQSAKYRAGTRRTLSGTTLDGFREFPLSLDRFAQLRAYLLKMTLCNPPYVGAGISSCTQR